MAVARKSPATTERPPVTISFAGYNRAWAAWIGDRLERHGHRVAYQRWDAPAETPLEDGLRDLLLAEGIVLIVLSDWYFQLGPHTTGSWNKALRAVVAPHADRFAAVTVTASALPTATASLSSADLWGVGAREAERRLLARLGTPDTGAGEAAAADRLGPRFPYDQPRVWGGVPRRNIRFTGREGTLNDIYHALQNSEPGAGVVTLLGMSGVGKTQIAAEYVYRFGSEYDAVWWASADQRGTLRQRLAELAPALGLTTGPEYGERLRAVGDALRRGDPYSRWLLVLDGADQPDAIADLLPSGPGHVLITSQNREWGEYNTALLEIPVYDREESVAFVRRRARRIEPADADLLAEALGDLPLALDQTAGSLNDSTMAVPEYIELLRSGVDVEVGLKVAADFPMTYYTAFSILLNRLRETVSEAVDLLRLCAFFAPGPIPLRLLRDLPVRDLPEQLAGLMDDPLRWTAAISKLVQYSVVRTESPDTDDDTAAGSEILHMHRMVHQTVRAGMSDADRQEFSRVVRRSLAAADPGSPEDTRQWPRYAELVPHLASSGVLESTNADSHRFVFNCLRYLYVAGEYTVGIQLAEAAIAAWAGVLGEEHTRVWELRSQYATLIRATGDYARTETIDREVAEHLRAQRGPQDPQVLRAISGLAADLRGLARYEEAHEVSRQEYEGYLELLGDQDTRTISAQNNIAVSLRLLGRYGEALAMDRKTLETCREVLRPRHRTTLLSETNYSWDLRLLGRYGEAVSVQERSMVVQRDILGPDHPRTLYAELNLAMCQHRSGDRVRALNLLARVLERLERVAGDDAPFTLLAAAAYSCVQREHGDLDRARAVGEANLSRYRSKLGARHPYAVGASVNHALVLRSAGERQQSQVLIEEALVDMIAALGPDHPWTLGVALNATATRNLAGDPEGAADLSRDTARRAAETLGARHPLSLTCRVALAADLRALRKRQEAEKVEEEAVEALASTLGAQHVHTVSARSRTRPFWDFEPLAV